jgi:hypothetical protein
MSESLVPPAVATAQSRRRRKRRLVLLLLALAVVLPVLALAGLFFYNRHLAELDLKAAIAETDALDPGWRLEDIEKRRTALPPEQNAALHITAAIALLPQQLLEEDKVKLWDAEESPQSHLDPELVEKLRNALEPLLPAESEIGKALPLKSGWYPLRWTPDYLNFSGGVPHADDLRTVGDFVCYLAMLRSHDAKHAEAWETALNVLAVGRSIGEEPTLVTMLSRASLRRMLVRTLERCLAQGMVPDDLLADGQRQLGEEASVPILLFGLRGERASMHEWMTSLETGKVDLPTLFGSNKSLEEILSRWQWTDVKFKQEHAWMLRFHNKAVESATLPPVQFRANMLALDREIAAVAPPLSRLFTSSLKRVADGAVRSELSLLCAVAGIGIERFRLRHGRWPDSLDEVVAAKLLDEVPTDYFDGKPLHYRKATDGVVIYSVGEDGKYTGDRLDEGRYFVVPFSTTAEFRLWDEQHRRQPPRPRPKVDEEKDGGGPNTASRQGP